MELKSLGIEGAWLAESPVWSDERGFFREWFKLDEISRVAGRDFSIAQANISSSVRGTVRGIHYSLAEGGQAKWVTYVSGAIRDVIVDIRPKSPTFKKWVAIELAGIKGNAVLIGEGLGHGFASLENTSIIAYLVTSPFSPAYEFEISALDPEIGIDWGIDGTELQMSPKDLKAPMLAEMELLGKLPKFQDLH